MKYILVYVGALTVPLALLYIANRPNSAAMDSRGEKNWSVTQRAGDGYQPIITDQPSPLPSHKTDPAGKSDRASLVPPAPTNTENESTAQAAKSGTSRINSELEDEKKVKPLQGPEYALKMGQAPGQLSNVPATTTTSPNPTSNLYGTGGIPVFPADLTNK